MRALRPAALPSDTSVRFVLLLAAVTTASLYLFQALWFAGRRQGFLEVVRECGLIPTDGTATLGGIVTQLDANEQCRAGISREQAVVAILGAMLVLVAAWGLYRLLPAWRERRRQLVEPDPLDGEALLASVADLAEQAEVRPVPSVRLDVTDESISGVAYGSGSRLRVGLSGGLVVSQITEPATYEAVVRHELGHVANRDVRWTYYSVSTWWSFLALALVPVVLTFAVRDPEYVLRLGWRTAVLAGLVATTLAALLRTRELYADARAAEWGSGPALDAVLARRASAAGTQSPEARRGWTARRPALLRLHPDPDTRRQLLRDADGLFSASGWVAFAAALACGTALASIADISYLLLSEGSIALSTLAVAPLLAIALCVPAWRVALRGAVRGGAPSIVLSLGLGAGVGLVIGPQLTMAAAIGGTVSGEGWWGYLIWSVAMVVLAIAVSWWICGTARLAIAAALGSARGPGRALAVHVVVTSLVIALWLALSTQARLLLTNVGFAELRELAPWDFLASSAFGTRLPYLPLALAPILLALPCWAHWRTRRDVPMADWPWRDRQPTQPGDLPQAPAVVRTRPPLLPVLVVGAAAGVVAGLVVLGVLVAGESLSPDLRTSDSFALALGTAIHWAIRVAGLVAGVVAVFVLPRLWWPLGLLASVVGMTVAGVVCWILMTVNRYGFLKHSDVPAGPLDVRASLFLLVEPAARATVLCAVIVALAGGGRALLPRRRTSAPVDSGPRAAPPVDSAPDTAPTSLRAPAPIGTAAPRWLGRSLVGALVAALACGLLVAPKVAGVQGLESQTVQTAWATVEVPLGWTGGADPSSGLILLDTLDGEVRVALTPIPSPGPPMGAGSLVVGGVPLPLVAELDQGVERWWVYEGQTPAGGQRVVIVGQPASVASHESDIEELLASVRWTSGAG